MRRVKSLLSFFLLAACGGSDTTPLNTDGYNKACSADADCVAIHSGQICGGCTCANDAINRADLSKYQAALKAIADSCSKPPLECPCHAPMAGCVQGVCVDQ